MHSHKKLNESTIAKTFYTLSRPCVRVCVCVHVHLCVYKCLYVFAYVFMYTCTCLYESLYVSTSMYVSMSVHVCDTDMFNELVYTCIIHVCLYIFFQYYVFVSTCEHI